jgi:hypothetical protein
MMEPELTARERELRDLYVNEYLVDYDPVKAAQRCGFQQSFAKDYAVKFMQESYVQKRIEFMKHQKVDEKSIDEYDKQRVRAVLMKEAHDSSSTGSARVSAAAKLAVILGMDAPTKIQTDNTHKGGVLMVPAIANISDWEAVAQASQAKLVADART